MAPLSTHPHPLSSKPHPCGKTKRCDQCIHRQRRCSLGRPCERCSDRKVTCTYSKADATTRARKVKIPVKQEGDGDRLAINARTSGSTVSDSSSPSSENHFTTPPKVEATMSAPESRSHSQMDLSSEKAPLDPCCDIETGVGRPNHEARLMATQSDTPCPCDITLPRAHRRRVFFRSSKGMVPMFSDERNIKVKSLRSFRSHRTPRNRESGT